MSGSTPSNSYFRSLGVLPELLYHVCGSGEEEETLMSFILSPVMPPNSAHIMTIFYLNLSTIMSPHYVPYHDHLLNVDCPLDSLSVCRHLDNVGMAALPDSVSGTGRWWWAPGGFWLGWRWGPVSHLISWIL